MQIVGDGVSSLASYPCVSSTRRATRLWEEWYEAGQYRYPYAATSPQGIVPPRWERGWLSCRQRRAAMPNLPARHMTPRTNRTSSIPRSASHPSKTGKLGERTIRIQKVLTNVEELTNVEVG